MKDRPSRRFHNEYWDQPRGLGSRGCRLSAKKKSAVQLALSSSSRQPGGRASCATGGGGGGSYQSNHQSEKTDPLTFDGADRGLGRSARATRATLWPSVRLRSRSATGQGLRLCINSGLLALHIRSSAPGGGGLAAVPATVPELGGGDRESSSTRTLRSLSGGRAKGLPLRSSGVLGGLPVNHSPPFQATEAHSSRLRNPEECRLPGICSSC